MLTASSGSFNYFSPTSIIPFIVLRRRRILAVTVVVVDDSDDRWSLVIIVMPINCPFFPICCVCPFQI
jgi:hypothetical protein